MQRRVLGLITRQGFSKITPFCLEKGTHWHVWCERWPVFHGICTRKGKTVDITHVQKINKVKEPQGEKLLV